MCKELWSNLRGIELLKTGNYYWFGGDEKYLLGANELKQVGYAIYADLGLGWTLTKDALPPYNTEVLATLGGIHFVEYINPNKIAEQDEDAYLPDEFRRTFDRWMLIPPYKKEGEG